MPRHANPDKDQQPGQPRLTFRNLHDEGDYPLLLELNRSSRQADHDAEIVSLEMI